MQMWIVYVILWNLSGEDNGFLGKIWIIALVAFVVVATIVALVWLKSYRDKLQRKKQLHEYFEVTKIPLENLSTFGFSETGFSGFCVEEPITIYTDSSDS